MAQYLTSRLLTWLRWLLALVVVPFLMFLRFVRPHYVIQVMLTNHQFFGHLALEPEKYLVAQSMRLAMREVEFNGDKHWSNLVAGPLGSSGNKVLTLWNFGDLDAIPNKQLFEMWKRLLRVVPSFVAGTLIRAKRIAPMLNISEYRYSSLLSVDRYLDRSVNNLRFTPEEIDQALVEMRNAGINPKIPWVCLIVRSRNMIETDSELRSRSIEDFVEAAELMAANGVQVIRMGAANSSRLVTKHESIIDYANSGFRTELLDLYLLAHCAFAVSTLSGPDAVCMAFRRPVLYVDIANYALCFSGTQLTTWVPAVLSVTRTGERLTLDKAFECGAGWFWRDSQFRDAGLTVRQSSSVEIANYTYEMIQRYVTNELMDESALQEDYRRVFAKAMGPLGLQWHGEIRSRISTNALNRDANWFLA